ncbi:UTRA domain-containing protein [Pseudoalteromonas sp. SR44-5]|uniref:GntR family transcriptional regulator n=1 Tax=unclassified Pseudoalteromonas TaxID=194690 RepID=UPI001600E00D|nr:MULTISPECIES: GntR family transcriptional regulator [unclassified Pseudoalteromonas]MBB1333225.1 UTRA domain-containing protein [Pseudoalteromonas sp. SR41-6]MBB1367374.1 UTRA domain-containing protein [Pseudoalteromonas sp. SR44-5]MBB1458925.1 UTRA domain-containing protein [Pseudoalteromonas sp. SG41-8]MBB1468935.1 UTRA domain-containing protein [Pseudoalteromonas sp. SG41-5]
MLLYQEIRNYIHTLLQKDAISAGHKLPSERELQHQFNSTRITVREALLRLEAEGLIFSQKRKGWFVTPKKLMWHPATKVNFYELAKQQGFAAKTELIESKKITNIDLKNLVNAPTLHHLQRVRSLDNRAVMFEHIYCDAERFSELEFHPLDTSITDIMSKQYATNVVKEQSVISITVLPDEISNLLEKNSGTPCLKVIRQRFDESQVLVDYNIEYWLHNAIEMVVEGQ